MREMKMAKFGRLDIGGKFLKLAGISGMPANCLILLCQLY